MPYTVKSTSQQDQCSDSAGHCCIQVAWFSLKDSKHPQRHLAPHKGKAERVQLLWPKVALLPPSPRQQERSAHPQAFNHAVLVRALNDLEGPTHKHLQKSRLHHCSSRPAQCHNTVSLVRHHDNQLPLCPFTPWSNMDAYRRKVADGQGVTCGVPMTTCSSW